MSLNFALSLRAWDLLEFKNLWCKNFGHITKHKTLEMEILHDGTIFEVALDLSWKGSCHAGPRFSIGIATLTFAIFLCDDRHWDYDNNCWEEKPDAITH